MSDKIVVWSDLTPKEREKILDDHRRWLSSSGGQRADLQGADLQGAYLQGADLQGAYLQGADLHGAYLQGADLQGAYLQGADLHGALLKDGLTILRIYQCGPQGSRDDYLMSFLCDDGKVYFTTGCQYGVEQKEFLKLVSKTHDGNNYGAEYKAAVAHCVKMLKLAENK